MNPYLRVEPESFLPDFPPIERNGPRYCWPSIFDITLISILGNYVRVNRKITFFQQGSQLTKKYSSINSAKPRVVGDPVYCQHVSR